MKTEFNKEEQSQVANGMIKNDDAFAIVRVEQTVKVETIKNLLTCAVEGGSTYWCEKIRPLNKDDKRDYFDYMLDGFHYWVDMEEDGRATKKTCNKDDLLKGLRIMAEKYPDRHFAHALDESIMDADTGDVYLQLCCFGEVVFG